MKKLIPFDFVLETIDRLSPYTKPMFGCTAVYVDSKIVFILRQRESHPEDNGVWLATSAEHHASLIGEFPSMRSISVLGGGNVTGWQILPEDSSDFEDSVFKACDMVLRQDPRIGKTPKMRTRSSKMLKKKPAKKKRRSPKRG